jgi:hypothetical protein
VDRFNALGANLDGTGRSLMPIDDQGALRAASAATGLTDYGDGWFRNPLKILTTGLEEEARLSLLGRVMAGAEIQRILQNRLRVESTLRQRPEIEQQPIEAPILVTGLGRSGTTALHEILARDPGNRVPLQWETMYSVPAPQTATFASDPRIEAAHLEVTLMNEIAPAFPSMHEITGDLPTECIYLFAHQFATDMFLGYYDIPSYAVWIGTTDLQPAYDYHRRLLQLLQWRNPGERWVLKAPSHLSSLADVFRTYPDARVIIAHRDPLRIIGSLCNLMGTLQSMRSDRVDYGKNVAMMSFGFVHLLQRLTRERSAGNYPEDRIIDVRYRDFVRDPMRTVGDIYERCQLRLSDTAMRFMQEHVATRRQGRHGSHEYSFADTGLDLATEREKYREYQERYGVESEV